MMVLADSVTGFKVPVGFGPTADGRCDCRGDTEGPAAPPNLPEATSQAADPAAPLWTHKGPDYHSYAPHKHQSNR